MEDDILIDNYLKGLLSKGEEKSFLERLETNTELKEKFKLEEQLFNSLNDVNWSYVNEENPEVKEYTELLKEDDLQKLKKTLTETNSAFNSNKETSSKRLFYYLAAASIVLFLGFQFFFNQNISNQELYNDYINLNDLPSFVSRSDDANGLTKAQGLFENKKYEEALAIFNSLAEYDGTIMIYKGVSESELGNYAEAEKTFDSLINSDLLDSEKGYWYKALLLIKADRAEDAKELLERITSKTLYRSSEAKVLLEKL